MKKKSHSPEETMQFGRSLGDSLILGDIILLFGDLGAGKTRLTQGICNGLGLDEESYIRSPTFTLINEYPGKLPIYHIDLYRIENQEALLIEEVTRQVKESMDQDQFESRTIDSNQTFNEKLVVSDLKDLQDSKKEFKKVKDQLELIREEIDSKL